MTPANGYIITPRAVGDALRRGIITQEMFDVLLLLYEWRQVDSNVVREVSAERLKQALSPLRSGYSGSEKKWPNVETIRRWMRGLLEGGWLKRDYESGVERPYQVFLQVLGGYNVENFEEPVQGRAEGCAGGRAHIENEDGAQTEANLADIRPWKQTSAFQGRAKESTSLSNEGWSGAHPFETEKDANTYSPQPPASDTPAAGHPAGAIGQNRPDGVEASEQLRSIIGWVPDSAPKTLGRLLQTFTFNEIKEAIQPSEIRNYLPDADAIKRQFRSSGAELEIHLRQNRKFNQVVDGLVIAGVDREKARDRVRQDGVPRVLEALRADANKKRKAAAAKAVKS